MDIFSRAVMKAHYWGRRHQLSRYTLIELQHKGKKREVQSTPKAGRFLLPRKLNRRHNNKDGKKGDDDVEKWLLLIQKKNNKNTTIE